LSGIFSIGFSTNYFCLKNGALEDSTSTTSKCWWKTKSVCIYNTASRATIAKLICALYTGLV